MLSETHPQKKVRVEIGPQLQAKYGSAVKRTCASEERELPNELQNVSDVACRRCLLTR